MNKEIEKKIPCEPEVKKKKINSRKKGCRGEQKYARIFRDELGHPKCRTSRQASRLLDDSKVDLAFVPYLVQIKMGYDKARPKPNEIFKEMKELVGKNFPSTDPIQDYPRILIHEIDSRCEENVTVTMVYSEWLEMMKVWERVKKEEIDDREGV